MKDGHNMDTIKLSEQKDGFWLYDTTRGMNLSMRAKTQEQAYREALLYYQKRLKEVEKELNSLKTCVSEFVDKVNPNENDM